MACEMRQFLHNGILADVAAHKSLGNQEKALLCEQLAHNLSKECSQKDAITMLTVCLTTGISGNHETRLQSVPGRAKLRC